MARAYIKGVLWGAGTSLGVLALVSVAGGVGEKLAVRTSAATTDAALAAPGANKREGNDGPSAVGLATVDVPAPEPDTLATLVADAFEPAAVPQTGEASSLSAAVRPDTEPLSGIANPSETAPDVDSVGAEGLAVLTVESPLSISTDPAQPPAPPVDPQATPFSDPIVAQAPETEGAISEGVAASDATEAKGDVTEAPDVLAEMDTVLQQPLLTQSELISATLDAVDPTQPPRAAPPQKVAVAVAPMVRPRVEATRIYPSASGPQPADAPMQPDVVALGELEFSAPSAVATEETAAFRGVLLDLPGPVASDRSAEVDDSVAAQVVVDTFVTDSVPAPREAIFSTPKTAAISVAPSIPTAEPLPEAPRTETALARVSLDPAVRQDLVAIQSEPPARPASEVRVNRLPSLGADPTDDIQPEPKPPATDAADPQAFPQLPVERYASVFEAPVDKPLVAVILLDEGGDLSDARAGLDAVRNLPYPVSIAIDPLAADASERMAAFRAAGFEVLGAVDLPQGASAADAEVNIAAALDVLPEMIAVLEGPGTGIQSSPVAGRQIAEILAQSGHGFVSQNRGLNTAQKLAARQGVPSTIVFRDIDASNPGEAVIRRFMDQAAFRAAQDGDVVMLGRLSADTLAALLSWSLQDRASTVAMAPVSAVLLATPGT